jgi:molybdenum cofactor synthesis domain-containing protein
MALGPLGITVGVVTVGDEIVEGRVANANAVWLTDNLMRRGMWPRLVVAVPDDEDLIVRMLRIAADSADVLIVSGGLGWTPDDVTRSSVARAFYRRLEVHPDVAMEIERSRGWADAEIARAAATFPEGAVPLHSPVGGVPGFTLRNVFVLPGAPEEMRAMFASISFEPAAPIYSHSTTFRTTEDRIIETLRAFETFHPLVRLGSYPDVESALPTVTLTLSSRDDLALRTAADWLRDHIAAEL